MFCYQCEQTTRSNTGAGCHEPKGVCGKDVTTADLQDLMIYGLQGIAQYPCPVLPLIAVSVQDCP